MPYASITGIGTYLPERLVTNEEIEERLGLDSGYIERRTGIRTRYHMEEHEDLIDMAVESSLDLFNKKGVPEPGIQRILFCFESPLLKIWENYAGRIQKDLKDVGVDLDENNFLNLPGGCAEYVDALNLAASLIESEKEDNILVIASSDLSRYPNDDNGATYLFGDGASTTLVQATRERGFLDFYGKGSGEKAHALYIGPREDGNWGVQMNGAEIYRLAVKSIEDSLKGLLEKTEFKLSDIDRFIFHQANHRIIKTAAKRIGIPPEKIHNTIQKYGNLSVTSIPHTADDAIQEGIIDDGDMVYIHGFGAGWKSDSAAFIYRQNPELV